MGDALTEAWRDLAGRLEARKRELAAAVRAYPTPIARCDGELPAAIERRGDAVRDLAAALEIEAAGPCAEAVRAFAARLESCDDAGLRAAAARVLAALEAP